MDPEYTIENLKGRTVASGEKFLLEPDHDFEPCSDPDGYPNERSFKLVTALETLSRKGIEIEMHGFLFDTTFNRRMLIVYKETNKHTGECLLKRNVYE